MKLDKKDQEAFEESERDEPLDHEQLVLNLDGYEGPIDVLLTLAKDQKLDISKISILQLAEQYLSFIETARQLRIEVAADYLVMAAWLAYLKSRMLVPEPEGQAEPTGAELAEALQFQLRRLEAMQKVAQQLWERPRLGVDFFRRGYAEGLKTVIKPVFELSQYDLLTAYGDITRQKEGSVYTIKAFTLLSVDDALERLAVMLGKFPQEWQSLEDFLPEDLTDALINRSAWAATFGATLEMAKRGEVEIRQENNFAPIYLRRRERNDEETENDASS